jgi:hypothetical protein
MAYVLVGIKDSEAKHCKVLSGKGNINCVNCALLDVEPHAKTEICASDYCSSARRYEHFKKRMYA